MKKNNSFILKQIEPSPEISLQIIQRIQKYEKRRCLMRITLHSTLSIGAIIAFIPTINYFWTGLIESGFGSYSSLIVSDWSYVTAHFNDLLLSMATTWPIPASILAIGITIIFINSLRRMMAYSGELSLKFSPQLS